MMRTIAIQDPCLNTITATTLKDLENDPTNLELQCLAALCFWYMPAIGARLVADTLLRAIDTTTQDGLA
jgi:hypothetical protein